MGTVLAAARAKVPVVPVQAVVPLAVAFPPAAVNVSPVPPAVKDAKPSCVPVIVNELPAPGLVAVTPIGVVIWQEVLMMAV